MKKNGNGSCFKNLAALCKENGWIFREFLLSDHQQKKPAGTAMKDSQLSCDIQKSKVELIAAQINNIKENHPDNTVDFSFFDDDDDDFIHNELAAHFNDPNNSLPNNFRHVSLMKYDWYLEVYQNEPALSEHTHIINPHHCLNSQNKSDIDKPDSSSTAKEFCMKS